MSRNVTSFMFSSVSPQSTSAKLHLRYHVATWIPNTCKIYNGYGVTSTTMMTILNRAAEINNRFLPCPDLYQRKWHIKFKFGCGWFQFFRVAMDLSKIPGSSTLGVTTNGARGVKLWNLLLFFNCRTVFISIPLKSTWPMHFCLHHKSWIFNRTLILEFGTCPRPGFPKWIAQENLSSDDEWLLITDGPLSTHNYRIKRFWSQGIPMGFLFSHVTFLRRMFFFCWSVAVSLVAMAGVNHKTNLC